MTLTVSNKILLGYLAVLVITVVTALTLATTTQGVKDRAGQFIEITLPQLDKLQTLNNLISLQEISAFSLYGTTINSERFDAQLRDYQQQMRQLNLSGSNRSLQSGLESFQSDLAALREVMTAASVDWDLPASVFPIYPPAASHCASSCRSSAGKFPVRPVTAPK